MKKETVSNEVTFVERSAPEAQTIDLVLPHPMTSLGFDVGEMRMAPGAHYTIDYKVVDKTGTPIVVDANQIQWRIDPSELAHMVSPGKVQALQPGKGVIIATFPGVGQKVLPLRVIGEPVELIVDPFEVSVIQKERVTLRVYAVDERGFQALLPEEDVSWETYGDIGTLTHGVLQATDTSASGAIVVSFGTVRGRAFVGVGGKETTVSNFAEAGVWRNTVYPAEVKSTLHFVSDPVFVRKNRPVARLEYDFTMTTKTRAAYIRPNTGSFSLPGRPLQLGCWVYGDGKGAWLRGQIIDRYGVVTSIDFAKSVDWIGWRYVEATIPDGIEYPISLGSIYVVETRLNEAYTGRIYFDEITATYAPEFDMETLPSPIVKGDKSNVPFVKEKRCENDIDFQFIVFGDSKVEAGKDHALGAQLLRRMIDEINTYNVPFVLFTGDLIENDTEANYELGKTYLDRLTMPYYVAPANHEIAGTGCFMNFHRFFGDTFGVFQYKNALFIKLNTARPGMHQSEPEQWNWFLKTSEEVAVDHVFIYMHIPTIDPLPGGTTGWSDRAEVERFEMRLAELAERVKNVYVFSGHVHGFSQRAHDGVQYITTAGAGSPLYMPPHQGGFYHYVLLTVAGKEVTYEVVPLIERIDVQQSVVRLTQGDRIVLKAEGVAPFDAVRFPLGYPAQVHWSVTDKSVGTIHPISGEFTALRPGTTKAQIRSAGQSATVLIVVEDGPAH